MVSCGTTRVPMGLPCKIHTQTSKCFSLLKTITRYGPLDLFTTEQVVGCLVHLACQALGVQDNSTALSLVVRPQWLHNFCSCHSVAHHCASNEMLCGSACAGYVVPLVLLSVETPRPSAGLSSSPLLFVLLEMIMRSKSANTQMRMQVLNLLVRFIDRDHLQSSCGTVVAYASTAAAMMPLVGAVSSASKLIRTGGMHSSTLFLAIMLLALLGLQLLELALNVLDIFPVDPVAVRAGLSQGAGPGGSLLSFEEQRWQCLQQLQLHQVQESMQQLKQQQELRQKWQLQVEQKQQQLEQELEQQQKKQQLEQKQHQQLEQKPERQRDEQQPETKQQQLEQQPEQKQHQQLEQKSEKQRDEQKPQLNLGQKLEQQLVQEQQQLEQNQQQIQQKQQQLEQKQQQLEQKRQQLEQKVEQMQQQQLEQKPEKQRDEQKPPPQQQQPMEGEQEGLQGKEQQQEGVCAHTLPSSAQQQREAAEGEHKQARCSVLAPKQPGCFDSQGTQDQKIQVGLHQGLCQGPSQSKQQQKGRLKHRSKGRGNSQQQQQLYLESPVEQHRRVLLEGLLWPSVCCIYKPFAAVCDMTLLLALLSSCYQAATDPMLHEEDRHKAEEMLLDALDQGTGRAGENVTGSAAAAAAGGGGQSSSEGRASQRAGLFSLRAAAAEGESARAAAVAAGEGAARQREAGTGRGQREGAAAGGGGEGAAAGVGGGEGAAAGAEAEAAGQAEAEGVAESTNEAALGARCVDGLSAVAGLAAAAGLGTGGAAQAKGDKAGSRSLGDYLPALERASGTNSAIYAVPIYATGTRGLWPMVLKVLPEHLELAAHFLLNHILPKGGLEGVSKALAVLSERQETIAAALGTAALLLLVCKLDNELPEVGPEQAWRGAEAGCEAIVNLLPRTVIDVLFERVRKSEELTRMLTELGLASRAGTGGGSQAKGCAASAGEVAGGEGSGREGIMNQEQQQHQQERKKGASWRHSLPAPAGAILHGGTCAAPLSAPDPEALLKTKELLRNVLTVLQSPFCCMNPKCSNISSCSEVGSVVGAGAGGGLAVGTANCDADAAGSGVRTTGVCFGCGLACYCSRACQESNWGEHSRVCQKQMQL